MNTLTKVVWRPDILLGEVVYCTTTGEIKGIPATDDEMNEFEEGGDPCIHVIRPYRDDEERLAVEAAHSPSVWRKP